MKKLLFFFVMTLIIGCTQNTNTPVVIDESGNKENIVQTIKIDSVWAGHPVGFCLLTQKNRQYIAYYNASRNMVVGQRKLEDDKFELIILPSTTRKETAGTSTVLGWDSHNYVTLGIDKEGYIHLSGNVHVNPLTYFRSTVAGDISTLKQVFVMAGTEEKRTTYPHFMLTKEGELLYHYRDGASGNGNEIYNIYNCKTKTWKRLLDTPLTDGQGLMNAYQSPPVILEDGWYHVYWVWRDTPDCSTNHDLSYMKSPDLKNWFNAFSKPLKLPATPDKKMVIVDPIPAKGGIINLAAKLCLDKNNIPVFVYHKFDKNGNTQLYSAQRTGDKWIYKQLTNWDYRWYFSGGGSINSEIVLKGFNKRNDGNYEVDYWHIKYGSGTLLLNDDFETIGKVLKPAPLNETIKVEGKFPGLLVQISNDIGTSNEPGVRYILKWETIQRHRDRIPEKPWPGSSLLYLYKVKKSDSR